MNGQIKLGQLRPINYFLSVAGLIGLMFAFVAPDDNLRYGWLGHFIHWQLQTVVPMLFAIAIHFSLSTIGQLRQLNSWVKLSITGVLTGLIFTPIALISDSLLSYEVINESVTLALRDELLVVAPPITVFWVAVNAPFILGWRLNKVEAIIEPVKRESDKELSNSAPAFFELISEEKRGEVILLKSELHYVQVVTKQGRSLILYSLKNAIRELEKVDGLQPHRSYWVSRAHIVSTKKNGREGQIVMSNGMIVPVSRARVQEISELS